MIGFSAQVELVVPNALPFPQSTRLPDVNTNLERISPLLVDNRYSLQLEGQKPALTSSGRNRGSFVSNLAGNGAIPAGIHCSQGGKASPKPGQLLLLPIRLQLFGDGT